MKEAAMKQKLVELSQALRTTQMGAGNKADVFFPLQEFAEKTSVENYVDELRLQIKYLCRCFIKRP